MPSAGKRDRACERQKKRREKKAAAAIRCREKEKKLERERAEQLAAEAQRECLLREGQEVRIAILEKRVETAESPDDYRRAREVVELIATAEKNAQQKRASTGEGKTQDK
ncbi:hypothetical protein N7532_002568 [Penicillium argentinense]|uniref:Uncharacterized protein n=1 Tax=Penicillium argentinense TaxID=1131581 RepID=A0A9W9G0W8_9EURO|nr:uncharacterized protein N7532_002568 [Penicillium argentinense]KAJ5109923.1 hypothetical protein N7532_002568 [Penicillium argentinense]